METEEKLLVGHSDGDLLPAVLIKQETEWLLEDSHAPDSANQELALHLEPLRSIKTEDLSCAGAEASVVHGLTPVPQTDEDIKTELMLDAELRGEGSQRISACELCHNIYPTQYMRAHMFLAHAELKYKCEFCSHSFKNKYDLKSHRNTHAKDRKPEFACDLCGLTFHNKSNLGRHREAHSSETVICESSVHKGNLKRQMPGKQLDDANGAQTAGDISKSIKTETFINSDHESQPSAPQSADTHEDRDSSSDVNSESCSQSFETELSRNMYLSTHAQDRKLKFTCKTCGRTFHSQIIMRKHMKAHDHNCRLCGKHFKQMENLKLHMRHCKCVDKTQKFEPPTSNEDALLTKSELMSDEELIDEGNAPSLRASHGPGRNKGTEQPILAVGDEKSIRVGISQDSATCDICHNSYPAELIEKHIRITHGIQTYKCPHCPRVFRKSNFGKHISTHDKNHTQPYACEQCGSKFLSEVYLKRHIVSHHYTRTPEFRCKICEKTFYTEVGLNLHMKVHTGKDVSCGVCGTRFTREQSLKEHMCRKHSNKT